MKRNTNDYTQTRLWVINQVAIAYECTDFQADDLIGVMWSHKGLLPLGVLTVILGMHQLPDTLISQLHTAGQMLDKSWEIADSTSDAIAIYNGAIASLQDDLSTIMIGEAL